MSAGWKGEDLDLIDGYLVPTTKRLGVQKAPIMPDAATQPDGTRFVKDFVSFADTGDKALQLIASLHSSRLAAWGFTAEADALGVEEYELKATLDNRTSKFCSLVANGRKFKITDARRKLVDVLSATDPEDLKTLQPWPSQDKASIAEYEAMSNQELADLGLLIPPFHPNCRTLLARTGTEYPDTGALPLEPTASTDAEVSDQAQAEDDVALGQSDLAPDDGTPTDSVIEASAFAAYNVTITDHELAVWNDVIALDPAVVFEMLDGVDPQDLLDDLADIDVSVADDDEITLSVSGDLAGVGSDVSVSHLYDPNDGTLYQNFLDFKTVDPAAAEDYLRTVYAGMVDLGDTLDATSIEFDASADTAGAAAVFGAAPVEQADWDAFREWAADNIAPDGELSDISDGLDEDELAVVFDLLSSDEPLAAVALAALPFEVDGTNLYDALFAGQSWIVGVDLTDPDLVARFKAFMGEG